jgi:exopolyphosphatase/guanosine-5'-triphosphate,3'-diphosphate pyrophosphatase
MKKVAVIDLGSNTFHLLIATLISPHEFEIEYKEAHFVKLASEGIEKIGETPFRKGIEIMNLFAKKCRDYCVSQIEAIGTEALRRAENAPQFLQEVFDQTGINVQIISGDDEAMLIAKGVGLAIPFLEEKVLIMDVGGGSVEFILSEKGNTIWAKSFPVGIAILYRYFHKSEPISPVEIHQLRGFLETSLSPLLDILKIYPAKHLVGASGTFDVLEDFLSEVSIKNKFASTVEVFQVLPLMKEIVHKSIHERKQYKQIPDTRVEMIVAALILIEYILIAGNFSRLTFSSYAMKEGILQNMMDDVSD